jgi:sugar phosphate isomerase/epimerase
VIHPSTDPVEDADGARRIQLAHEALREMEARLPAGADIKIAVECLPRTNLCHDSAEAVEFIQPLGERFGICLDVNHTNFREDPVQAVRAYARHTITTHIADNDGVHEKHWMPGDGVIPWKPRYAALIAAGYTGPILYETGQAEGESTEHVVVDW